MKNIITSTITTLIVIGVFMVFFTNIIEPKEPITLTENVKDINIEENNNLQGITIKNNSEDMTISTSSVVGIAVEKKYGNKMTSSLGNEYSVGSGFIIDSSGYIITNYHVIGTPYSSVYVTLYGGDTVRGKTVWANKDLDLAIVKIEVAGLPVMPLGDSKNIRIGENVIAIGNPLGFEFQRTVTSGIISGLNRSISIEGSYMEDLIQTDASINPGNSGGPLVNGKGEAIGINTIKVEAAEGLGFAIPVNQIKPIINKIKETGEFKEPYLGILGYDKEMISNITSDIKLTKGIYVYDIEMNSPAKVSGIQKGDILLSIDNIEVNTLCEVREILFSKDIDEVVNLRILTNGIEREIPVELIEKI